ncbi:MAG: hypothetical protein DRI94_09720 [Bacteroidetes bacterium]|nr:MAG: hypothetical protein DRI94_09720 [Bacteroidota bacterium]
MRVFPAYRQAGHVTFKNYKNRRMKKQILSAIVFLISINSFAQKAVPDFSVTDIYGHTHKLYSDYLNQNKYVFIDFFTVGCQSCAELSPVIDTVYKNFGCNYGDVVFLGIDGYYDDPHVFEFTQNYQMTFPASSGNEGGGNQVFTDFNINYTPYKILIDPTGKIIADYPFETSVKYYRDTLLAEGLILQPCSGNDFWFFSLLSESDSIVGEINETDKTINILMPNGTDLSQLTAFFVAESNSVVKINGTEQISSETVNDFSQGALVYDITSEDGTTESWTVTAATSSVSNISDKNINIYPNPVKTDFFIDFTSFNFKNIQSELYNSEGKRIKSFTLKEANSLINISDIPSGIYFLKIRTNNNLFIRKIVKK